MNKKNTHSQLSTYFSKDYKITTTGNGRIYVSASLGDMLLILFLGEICVISGPAKTRKSPIVIEPNIKECSQCITLKKENEDLIDDITEIREDNKQANRRVSQIVKLNKKLNCKMQQLQKDFTGAQQHLKNI